MIIITLIIIIIIIIINIIINNNNRNLFLRNGIVNHIRWFKIPSKNENSNIYHKRKIKEKDLHIGLILLLEAIALRCKNSSNIKNIVRPKRQML